MPLSNRIPLDLSAIHRFLSNTHFAAFHDSTLVFFQLARRMTDISKASHGSSAPSATVPPSSEPHFPSAPLIPAPPGEMTNNVSKFSVWPFRKSSHNRNKSRNSSPILERSKSEPNSPTEPTMAAARSNNKEGDKPNYIIMARDLLNDTKLRFEGHKKEWSEFYDRYNQ